MVDQKKQADVCYSWWILSSMSLLGIMHYMDGKKLATFILKAQDPDDGGIADRPDDMADVFHTFFGISGLSLLGYLPTPQFGQIDPVYALPVPVVKRLGLPSPSSDSVRYGCRRTVAGIPCRGG
jgi:geranylgeranyl transferase type-2 subunit beta